PARCRKRGPLHPPPVHPNAYSHHHPRKARSRDVQRRGDGVIERCSPAECTGWSGQGGERVRIAIGDDAIAATGDRDRTARPCRRRRRVHQEEKYLRGTIGGKRSRGTRGNRFLFYDRSPPCVAAKPTGHPRVPGPRPRPTSRPPPSADKPPPRHTGSRPSSRATSTCRNDRPRTALSGTPTRSRGSSPHHGHACRCSRRG